MTIVLEHVQRNLRSGQIRLTKWSMGLLALWIAAMLGLPIARWIIGDEAIPVVVVIAAVLQAGAVYAMTQQHWGHKRSLQALAGVAILTWAAEALGSKTGVPFGHYQYTDTLQPQFLGVPLLIPIAWFMMLPPSWAIAYAIIRRAHEGLSGLLLHSIVSAVIITAWDLFLDPQMVAWNFWVWDNPEGYFGIPWSNYAGWVITAFVVTLAIRPGYLPLLPLGIVYGLVWFLQSIGQAFFWNQPGPALVGSIAMGLILALAFWRYRDRGV